MTSRTRSTTDLSLFIASILAEFAGCGTRTLLAGENLSVRLNYAPLSSDNASLSDDAGIAQLAEQLICNQ